MVFVSKWSLRAACVAGLAVTLGACGLGQGEQVAELEQRIRELEATSTTVAAPTTTRPLQTTTTIRTTTTTRRVTTTTGVTPFSQSFAFTDTQCTGENYSIGMKGKITNVGNVIRDFWITVELADADTGVRLDLTDTVVRELKPDQTAEWEVSHFQDKYVEFRCQIIDIAESPF